MPLEPARRHALTLAALSCSSACGVGPQLASGPAFAPGPPFAEDAKTAAALQDAWHDFLSGVQQGTLLGTHPSFFTRSVLRGLPDAEPVVLKSHPLGNGRHCITAAFVRGAHGARAISRIVELDAIPDGSRFVLACPYERRTGTLQAKTLGSVTFRFRGTLDERRAREFVGVKERLDQLTGHESRPLQYDCFGSLDALLKAFGLVHDSSKCNFLQHDLGFLSDDGERFITGTGDPAYLFGYVRGLLSARAKNPDAVFAPYANGVAAYYGGYSLSGDTVEVLAKQFRDALARRPDIDFLEMFRKGRGSSIQRHFSHYVMCAFVCRELVARHGEREALALVECGADGERFFPELERLLGVTEETFHAAVLRWIQA